MIAAPPVVVGAVHDSRTSPSPAVPETLVGAPGTVAGVTADEGEDGDPVREALVAVTVKVYAMPLVSPVTVQLVDEVEHVCPPGLAVTV